MDDINTFSKLQLEDNASFDGNLAFFCQEKTSYVIKLQS